jgi:GT2 family glycosyltransferase
MLWLQARGGVVSEVFPEASGVNVSHGRNNLCRATLASDCDWLLMLDADMTFTADLPQRLLANAHPDTAPVVGGLCFGIDDGRLFPTLYDFTEQDGQLQTVRYEDYPRDTLFPVGATGAACLLIHRNVLTAVEELNVDSVFPWFQEVPIQGQRFGEDMTFCLRVAAVGAPIHVDTSVHIGHQKASVLTAEMHRHQRIAEKVAGADTGPLPTLPNL